MVRKLTDIQDDWNIRMDAMHKTHIKRKLAESKHGKKEKKIEN